MERYELEIAGLPSDPGELAEYVREVADQLARLVRPERDIVHGYDEVAQGERAWRCEYELSGDLMSFDYRYDDEGVRYEFALQSSYDAVDAAEMEWEVAVWVEPVLPPMPQFSRMTETVMLGMTLAAVVAAAGAALFFFDSKLLAAAGGFFAFGLALWLGFRYQAYVNRPWQEHCDRLRRELDDADVHRFQQRVLEAVREHPTITLT